MQHAARACDVHLRQLTLLTWRHYAARRARLEALASRQTKQVRLSQAAQKWRTVLKRAAFSAIRADATERLQSSKATAALARFISRRDRSEGLDTWRKFIAWETAALAKAMDAFPALHRCFATADLAEAPIFKYFFSFFFYIKAKTKSNLKGKE